MTSSMVEGLGSFGAHLLDEAELRDRVARWLASHDGLRSSGATERDYEEVIFPADDPSWRHRYADEAYSCALWFRAVLYHVGVPHPLITKPYRERVGHAVADLSTVARAYGALVEGPALASYEPRAGDALCSTGPAGPHVSCVTSGGWQPGPRLFLECVDGGQGRKNDMAVERNAYLFDRRPGGPAIMSVEAPAFSPERPGPPRPILWGIDLWRLLLNAGLCKA